MTIALAPNLTHRFYSWTAFKALMALKSGNHQYVDDDAAYTVWFYDEPEVHVTTIWKGTLSDGLVAGGFTQQQNDDDLADFEANFKPTANKPGRAVDGADAIQNPTLIAGIDSDRITRYLRVTQDGTIGVTPIEKIKLFTSLDFLASDTPAKISTSGSGPYTVGGQTLTVTVNGTQEQYAFAARAATKGTSVSASQPGTSTATANKMKISVDGGSTKEISISTSLRTGATIAAALQSEIRSRVSNGSNVTVDYGVTNPGKYTISSGTTGASSRVVVSNGNCGVDNDLARALKLGVPNNGIETVGLAGNLYSNTEVAALLDANISDITAEVAADGKVSLTTTSKGTGATILVASGGANTYLSFPTTTVAGIGGSGYSQLNVNGSTAAVSFEIPATPGKLFVVTDLYFRIRDGSGTMGKFGGLTELTNGIRIDFRTQFEPLRTLFTAKTNAELLSLASTGDLMVDAYSNGDELIVARLSLVGGVPVRPGSSDGIFVVVRDNLTGLTSFSVQARGYLENL